MMERLDGTSDCVGQRGDLTRSFGPALELIGGR